MSNPSAVFVLGVIFADDAEGAAGDAGGDSCAKTCSNLVSVSLKLVAGDAGGRLPTWHIILFSRRATADASSSSRRLLPVLPSSLRRLSVVFPSHTRRTPVVHPS